MTLGALYQLNRVLYICIEIEINDNDEYDWICKAFKSKYIIKTKIKIFFILSYTFNVTK